MFAFIADFFRGRPEERESSYKPATTVTTKAKPNSRTISYDPHLIRSLKEDHSKLVNLYERMWKEGFEKRNYRQLSSLLAEFKSTFQSHLLKENVKFYVYLEQSLQSDVHTLQVVKDFRVDMNDIANAVIQFCKRYQHDIYTADMEKNFEKDYVAVGEVLTRRVGLEENELYTLYSPN